DLPNRASPTALEIALNRTQHVEWESNPRPPSGDEAGESGLPTAGQLLERQGWRVADGIEVGRGLDPYRHYIQSSKAEWSVAKNGYVVGQAGWFSCRSACYLAAGRPVVVQDTGFGGVLPTGEGILTFRTVDEAVGAIREVEGDWARHAKAAQTLAHEYFDSDKVLSRLIEDAFSPQTHAVAP